MAIKIYIAGPINGTTDAAERFERAENRLREAFPGATIYNPQKLFQSCEGVVPEPVILSFCLAVLAEANAAYFLRGWKNSHGAGVEYEAAVKANKNILFEL